MWLDSSVHTLVIGGCILVAWLLFVALAYVAWQDALIIFLLKWRGIHNKYKAEVEAYKDQATICADEREHYRQQNEDDARTIADLTSALHKAEDEARSQKNRADGLEQAGKTLTDQLQAYLRKETNNAS